MASFYSPYINHFIQPDTVIPDPSNPQAWNRFSYVYNNPIRFNDPTGHSCREDGKGCESGRGTSDADIVRYTTRFVEENYSVKIIGSWKKDELKNLAGALNKLARYLNGTSNLNTAFTNAAQSLDANATGITVERVVRARINPNSTAPSVAGWCNGNTQNGCSKTTILVADDTFSRSYQYGRSKYSRPTSFNLDERIQFTLAHEFTHVLADANPVAVNVYEIVWQGEEEDMANEFAESAISQGSLETQFSGWAVDYGFWDYP